VLVVVVVVVVFVLALVLTPVERLDPEELFEGSEAVHLRLTTSWRPVSDSPDASIGKASGPRA
jgi:hypothetical protein